ncbi:MAG: polyprenyl synthetase family protein [Lachnospiraceae bacterium]
MEEKAFRQALQERTNYCEKVVKKWLPRPQGFESDVITAANYSVLAGGKRLRPLIMEETGRMYCGRADLREPFLAAIEMIHTYSLIHDDLPAMDNDTLRRGKKTTWAMFGEGMAVIAGDGLLNYAYETALRAFDLAEGDETQRVVRALRVLARNAGFFGMVGGQCADLLAEKRPAGEVKDDLLTYIHENKTAAMIRSAFQIGAILAGAPEDDVIALGSIADDVGLAFQIQDDILDVKGDAGTLGKSIGKDEAEGKATYVTLHGLDGAKTRVEELTGDALRRLDKLSETSEFLRALVEHLMTRTR